MAGSLQWHSAESKVHGALGVGLEGVWFTAKGQKREVQFTGLKAGDRQGWANELING